MPVVQLEGFLKKSEGIGTQQYRAAVRRDPCVWCMNQPTEQGSGNRSGTIEHVLPKSLGGKNGHDNIAHACASCNSKRSSTGIVQFMIEKGWPVKQKPTPIRSYTNRASSWGQWIRKQTITLTDDYFWRFYKAPPIPWYDLPILHGGWRR
jgi:hypothetical protein